MKWNMKMKCKTCIITIGSGVKEVYSNVTVFQGDSGVTLMSGDNYIWYDPKVVIKIECLGYELERLN